MHGETYIPRFYGPDDQEAEYAVIEADDGVSLNTMSIGPTYGIPTIHIGGQPYSMYGPHPTGKVLGETASRLISFDRRGYGTTPRKKGRVVADTAHDIRKIMDDLDIERVGILSRSGGVIHALGMAALYPERVLAVVGMRPKLPPGVYENQITGDTTDNQITYQVARNNPAMLEEIIKARAEAIRSNPDALLDILNPELTFSDIIALNCHGLDSPIAHGHAQGIGEGYGWIDDTLASMKPWGFDLKDVKAPVLLIAGDKDPFVSDDEVGWLNTNIPNAETCSQSLGGHLDSVLYTDRALRYILYHAIGGEDFDRLDALVDERYEKLAGVSKTWSSPTTAKIINTINHTPINEITPALKAPLAHLYISEAAIWIKVLKEFLESHDTT